MLLKIKKNNIEQAKCNDKDDWSGGKWKRRVKGRMERRGWGRGRGRGREEIGRASCRERVCLYV